MKATNLIDEHNIVWLCTCHGVSWGGFVNVAISAMVYSVLLFWRPPVACYGEAAIYC